jgi:hypothetical protein
MGLKITKPVVFDPVEPEYPLKIFWHSTEYGYVSGLMLCAIRDGNKIDGKCYYHPGSSYRAGEVIPFSLDYVIEQGVLIGRSPLMLDQQLSMVIDLSNQTGQYTSLMPLDVGKCSVRNPEQFPDLFQKYNSKVNSSTDSDTNTDSCSESD